MKCFCKQVCIYYTAHILSIAELPILVIIIIPYHYIITQLLSYKTIRKLFVFMELNDLYLRIIYYVRYILWN